MQREKEEDKMGNTFKEKGLEEDQKSDSDRKKHMYVLCLTEC